MRHRWVATVLLIGHGFCSDSDSYENTHIDEQHHHRLLAFLCLGSWQRAVHTFAAASAHPFACMHHLLFVPVRHCTSSRAPNDSWADVHALLALLLAACMLAFPLLQAWAPVRLSPGNLFNLQLWQSFASPCSPCANGQACALHRTVQLNGGPCMMVHHKQKMLQKAPILIVKG